MPQVINLSKAKLKTEELVLLGNFFKDKEIENKEVFFSVNHDYEAISHNGLTQFSLTHNIVRRSCASEKNAGLHRYEVIGTDEIGSGKFGKVFNIIGTLASLQNGELHYKTNKKRGKKIKHHSNKPPPAHTEKKKKMKEKPPHLPAKNPVDRCDVKFLSR